MMRAILGVTGGGCQGRRDAAAWTPRYIPPTGGRRVGGAGAPWERGRPARTGTGRRHAGPPGAPESRDAGNFGSPRPDGSFGP